MSPLNKTLSSTTIKKWSIRFIKYNLIGMVVFGASTIVYVILFPMFYEWTLIFSSIAGGIIDFTLVAYLNRTGKWHMFDSDKNRTRRSSLTARVPLQAKPQDRLLLSRQLRGFRISQNRHRQTHAIANLVRSETRILALLHTRPMKSSITKNLRTKMSTQKI